jgi:small subunit ribosomal protein S17
MASQKTLTGTVASNKMQKALVVTVFTIKLDPKYHKRFKTQQKYHVACADSTKFSIGDSVQITTCRPVSKTISYKVVE